MKMSEKTLLKKIEQAFKENYCNGSYKVEVDVEFDEVTAYVLFYTYETGEVIALDIDTTRLGEVKFYSPVHSYYISNFHNHTKSVINVLRMLFDMIESNKEQMISYYEIKSESTATETTAETEKNYSDYTSEDFINAGIAKECTNCVDFCEEDCIKNAECAKGNDVSEGCQPVKSIREVDKVCGDCSHYNACMQGYQGVAPTCCMFDSLYNSRKNLNWHHVSLKTLANIDNDMLDEKRRVYMKIYRMTANIINTMYKCNKLSSIDTLRRRLISTVEKMWAHKVITYSLVHYVKAKIDNCYLVVGLLSSMYASSYSDKVSRTYKKVFYI